MSDPHTASLLDVIEAREKKDGGRESLTHLCYVAITSDIAAAVRFHENVCAIISKSALLDSCF